MRSKRLLDVAGQWVLSHCEPSLPGKPGGWVSWAARGTIHVTAPLVALHWWLLTHKPLDSHKARRPRRGRARTLALPVGGYPGERTMLPDVVRWLASKELAS